jgi:hypothetical protein
VPIEAIAFGWMLRPGHQAPKVHAKIRAVYRLDVNEYMGKRRLQLLLEDVVVLPE